MEFKELSYIVGNLSKHADWSNKIRLFEVPKLMWQEIVTFNRSISFLMELTFAKKLLKVQKLLNIKGYHNCQMQYSRNVYTTT